VVGLTTFTRCLEVLGLAPRLEPGAELCVTRETGTDPSAGVEAGARLAACLPKLKAAVPAGGGVVTALVTKLLIDEVRKVSGSANGMSLGAPNEYVFLPAVDSWIVQELLDFRER
jgi:hypothetical protein